MRYLSVDSFWIVGTPSHARDLSRSVTNWLTEETGWNPDGGQVETLEAFVDEIVERYDDKSKGFAAFATQIIDATLNRVYPYLVQYSLDNNMTIELERKTKRTPDDGEAIVYIVSARPSDEPPPDTEKGELAPISENPFPLPGGLSPFPDAYPPGTPPNPAGSNWSSTPYDPYNPLSREPSPYPDRQENPFISSPPDTIETGRNDPFPVARQPEREPKTEPEPEPGEEPEPVPGEEPEPGEELEEKPVDDIAGILRQILNEIRVQGEKTRDAITTAYQTVSSTITGLHDAIGEQTKNLIDRLNSAIKTVSDGFLSIQQTIRGSIADQTEAIREDHRHTVTELKDALLHGLKPVTGSDNAIVNWFENRLSDIFEMSSTMLQTAIESVANGIRTVRDAVSHVAESVSKVPSTITDTVSGWIAFEPDDLMKWICQFYRMVEKLKNECGFLNTKD